MTLRDTNFLSRSVTQGILAPRSDRTSICRAPAIPSVALQLVAHHDPQPPGLGLAQAGGEHRDGGVVGMQRDAGADVAADRLGERREQEDRLADPVGKRARSSSTPSRA